MTGHIAHNADDEEDQVKRNVADHIGQESLDVAARFPLLEELPDAPGRIHPGEEAHDGIGQQVFGEPRNNSAQRQEQHALTHEETQEYRDLKNVVLVFAEKHLDPEGNEPAHEDVGIAVMIAHPFEEQGNV